MKAFNALPLYTKSLTFLGLAAGADAIYQTVDLWSTSSSSAALLGAALVTVAAFLGGARIVEIKRDDGETDRISTSASYVVALVIMGPVALALLVLVAVYTFWHLRGAQRPPLHKTLFNIAQAMLSVVVARWAYLVLSGADGMYGTSTDFQVRDVLAGVVAAGLYFLLNNIFVIVAISLSSGLSPLAIAREDLRLHTLLSASLALFGPIVAVLMDVSPLLLPLSVLPALVVRHVAHKTSEHQHRSQHDPLTELPNRSLFIHRVEKAIDESYGDRVSVMIVDLDHFKEINDTLGHTAGDDLLRVVATRLSDSAHDGVQVFRLGGDEFAVLVRDTQADPEQIARGLMASLSVPITVTAPTDGLGPELIDITVQGSVGISYYPEHASTPNDLMRHADFALYQAKESRGDVQVYSSILDSSDRSRLRLATDLHEAVAAEELEVFFQPQVDSATHELIGLEALTRWRHPVRGFVSPDEFIPIAESTGLITEMSRWLITQSLRTLKELRNPQVTMSVNISPRLLINDVMTDWIAAELDRFGVCPHQLVVEVTESTLISDPERAIRVLSKLRDSGVQLSIDDFGTGYSSLAYLARLKPDEMKIDKSFVMNMDAMENAAIVQMAVSLGQKLGVRVVAEGIEDLQTAHKLRDLACSSLQGYYFAKPMPQRDLRCWISQRVTRLEQRVSLTVS